MSLIYFKVVQSYFCHYNSSFEREICSTGPLKGQTVPLTMVCPWSMLDGLV